MRLHPGATMGRAHRVNDQIDAIGHFFIFTISYRYKRFPARSLDKMTKVVHLVIMERWNYERLQQVFDEMLGSGDPADPKERKRLRIVKAATELFMQQGYRKTTIAEVAARAGVAKGTVYLYVRNKGELVAQAIGEEKREYLVVLRDVLNPSIPPREQLRGWLHVALISSTRMPLVARLMSGDQELMAALADMPEEMQQQRMEIGMEMLSSMLDEAAGDHRWTDSELRDRAQVLMGMLHFTMVIGNPAVRGHLSLDRFAEILSDVITDGLCPVQPSPRSPKEAAQREDNEPQPPSSPVEGGES